MNKLLTTGLIAVSMALTAASVPAASPQQPAAPAQAQPATPAQATASAAPAKAEAAKPVVRKKYSYRSKAHRTRVARLAHRLAHVRQNEVWYTPMSRPGMPRRYDIAGWHSAKPSSLIASAGHLDTAAVRVAARRIVPNTPVKMAAEAPKAPVTATFHDVPTGGKWYTPATRPGMTSRYDIRGLHRRVGKL